MKIRLLGDHSRYHCGSKAVWEVLSREAARHGTLVSDDSFDLLVVNGEGSMHHGSAGCHRKIEAISEALGSGRRAMLVNTVWQDNPPGLASVLTGCERVTARELMSARVLEAEGVRADLCLDLSYYRPIDPAEPHDFGGGVVMTDFWSNEFDTFAKVTGKWAARHAYVDMQDWDWSCLVTSLKTAGLFVTGRHHGVDAACKARTPFLALKGNTHKIEALGVTAGLEIPVFETLKELRAAMEAPDPYHAQCDALFDWMERQPVWTLF